MIAMDVSNLQWWEREKLLTDKDKEAIARATAQHYGDIDEDAAETDAGRYELHSLIMRKYHNEEHLAGML